MISPRAVSKIRKENLALLDRMGDELATASARSKDWAVGVRAARLSGGGRHAQGDHADPTGEAVAAGSASLHSRLDQEVARYLDAGRNVNAILDEIDVHRKALDGPTDEERADLHDANLKRGFCAAKCGNWCTGATDADRLKYSSLVELDLCPPCYTDLRRWVASIHAVGLEVEKPALDEWKRRRRTGTVRTTSKAV